MSDFICKYFERIGLYYDSDAVLNYELLKKIQYAHVTNIPYENTDILSNIPLSLNTDDLFQKIVINKRGGYCFELNGLLGRLLRELGFEVHDFMARFLRGETEIPMRRHRVLYVEGADKKPCICDVGVGSVAPRYPIPLIINQRFEQFSEVYRFREDDFFGTVLEELYKGEWRDVYGFTFEEQLDIDYIMPSFYCEKHPDSVFNKDYMIAIKTETGRKTLDKNIYKEFRGEEIILIKELANSEIAACLQNEFGIVAQWSNAESIS